MHRADFHCALLFITVCLLGIACSTTPDDGTAKKKKTVDAATSVPLPVEVTITKVDPWACPRGHGCECAADGDCDYGVCLDGADGKSCSLPCGHGCPPDLACATLDKAGATIHHCVPAHVDLCDPCTATEACTSLGRDGSACVSYGAAGNFCGSACDGDADCPTGYACESALHAEGGTSLQCVKKPDKGGVAGVYGTCGCSVAAKAGKFSTVCWKQTDGVRCYGARACSEAGLSDCDAAAAGSEKCDGVDNDCNGLVDEDTCGDGNPCTTDSCAGGKCDNVNVTGPCNSDDSVCTSGDACKDGACQVGDVLKCDDNNICTKDSCDPVKGCQNVNEDATPCDADGSKCTPGDACLDGTCTAGDLKVCDDNKTCTVDSCEAKTGDCKATLIVGLACDDGDVCTLTDLCQTGGDCKGTVRTCNDGNVCTVDTCNKTKAVGAACEHSPNTKACDDGNKCTTGDKCLSKACGAGAAKVCTASKACMTVYCDGLTGKCVEVQAKDGFGCDDGDKCTESDRCDATGKCKAGTPKVCGDGPACASASCDTKTGKCVAGQAADKTPCDDGNICTDKSACKAGKCEGGVKKDCDDKKVCTVDSCETGKGCVNTNLDDGKVCDDGVACNLAKCAAGSCLKTKDICSCSKSADCDDENPCTTGTCNTAKCAYSNKTAGDVCDDLDKCTNNDKCVDVSGKLLCQGPDKTDCDDKEACTTDSCHAVKGCQHAALKDDEVCDDASKCTSDTKCSAGKCKGTEKKCTDNGKACRPNVCDGSTGNCGEADAKDGTKCEDGNKCTENDGCKTGKCEGDPLAAKVITLAGSGSAGYKDGKGTGASFNGLAAVTVDASGNVFVAEGTINNFYRIRKIAADGTTTTRAGSGLAGSDNGVGTKATFRAPRGLVAVGDDLYVADTGNALIRKIDKDDNVTTLAGLAATSNHPKGSDVLYFGVRKGAFKDDKGNAAKFNVPYGIAAVGSGATAYLVVADTDNHRIRKVALDGTVTTVAGSGTLGSKNDKGTSATFNYPVGIAVDGTTLYVAEYGGHLLRKIAADGTVTTLAGSGAAGFKDDTGTVAQFKKPFGLAIDVNKTLLVADYENYRVRAIKTTDGKVTTYSGSGVNGLLNGKVLEAKYKGLWDVAADGNGNTYAVSPVGHALRVIQDPYKACTP